MAYSAAAPECNATNGVIKFGTCRYCAVDCATCAIGEDASKCKTCAGTGFTAADATGGACTCATKLTFDANGRKCAAAGAAPTASHIPLGYGIV